MKNEKEVTAITAVGKGDGFAMKKNIFRVMALTAVFASLSTTAAFAAHWGTVGKDWFYYLDDGTVEKNMWVNTTAEDGTVTASYWVKSNGKMAVNEWLYDGESWYYVDGSGLTMKDQLLKLNSDLYWLDPDGKMVSNDWRQTEDGKWYFFQENGVALKNGWKVIDGEEYYFLKSGVLAVDALVPGGYRVDASGRKIIH